jgi:hypothetical protein
MTCVKPIACTTAALLLVALAGCRDESGSERAPAGQPAPAAEEDKASGLAKAFKQPVDPPRDLAGAETSDCAVEIEALLAIDKKIETIEAEIARNEGATADNRDAHERIRERIGVLQKAVEGLEDRRDKERARLTAMGCEDLPE